MTNQLSNPNRIASIFSLLSLFLLFCLHGMAQVTPEQQACLDIDISPNPEFPGCQAPGSADVFKVLLVMDESASMGYDSDVPPLIKQTIRDFAVALKNNATGPGQFEMGIAEFSSDASLALPLTDVTSDKFLEKVDDYRNTQYNPSGGTNFTKPLKIIFTDPGLDNLDIVFFVSDGNPNWSDPKTSWQPYADSIKCIKGTYIFGIALGELILDENIQALSGEDELNNPKTLMEGADWLREDVSGIADALVDLANSLIDKKAPEWTCVDIKDIENDPGLCSAVVDFDPPVIDNCALAAVVWVPPSGSALEVGGTPVKCIATDEAGNSSECEFTVTVIDTEAPSISCSNITKRTDPGACNAVVTFDPFTEDNCTTDPPVVCFPPSGSAFNVGTTIVNCTVTDEAGNTDNCSFSVKVEDKEPPSIVCPEDRIINCDDPKDPSFTGEPLTGDNCGVDQVMHSDTETRNPADCSSNYLIERLWEVFDVHANRNDCLQRITVRDITAPVIDKPDDITVTCDTSTAVTGMATLTDNCDPNPKLSYSDAIIDPEVNGDCYIKCIIHRIWVGIDNCGNKSQSIQVITKDITPLIEEALEEDLDGDGISDPLVLGTTQTTLTIEAEDAACIGDWLPHKDGRPVALKRGNQEVDSDCVPGTNELSSDDRIVNALFGEGLKLALYLRLHPEYGEEKLSTLDCDIAPIVLQTLSNDPDINEFMRVTNIALGNLVLVPHLRELLDALKCINGPLDPCDEELKRLK